MRKHKLSTRILLAMLAILAVTSVIGFGLLALAQRAQSDRDFEQRAASIARTAASDPPIRAAMASGAPPRVDGVVQTEAQRIATASGASYVVVIDLNRIRHSHPLPALIGQPVAEPVAVLDGQTHVGINTGATGRSANGKVPVYGPDNRLVGEVSAGIPVERATTELLRELPTFGLYAGIALAIGSVVSFVLARRLKRSTFGLELDEIAGLLQDREAMLHGIGEGVVCFDAQGRITVVNGEARRLLGLPENAEGRSLAQLGVDRAVAEALSPGHVVANEVLAVGDRLLAVNNWPTGRDGGPPGSVATLRDSTELQLLSRKAEAARRRLKLLYDLTGAVGTTLDVTRTAEELARVPVPHFADYVTVDLVDSVLRGEEPAPDGGVVMCRVAVHGVSDVHPFIPRGATFRMVPTTPQAWAFGHGQAVLEPNLHTSTGWLDQDPARARDVLDAGIHSRIAVPLGARGILLGMVIFWRREKPGPFDDDDLSLAEELVARAAVSIDNARRYTREHELAVSLQHSLLPRGLPEQSALDLAYRYLPAQSGVGGDWFDVLPLPGARVAMTVGDVVGHGLHAAATMGRLRTAVHNFSALDLPPDELLWHLDDLVARIDQDAAASGDSTAVTGATCLYVVYDPSTRLCTMARAAHPPPAIVLPDGTVEFPDIPAGPPLGLVALPFESVQLRLPEGSQLVLYTDGLVEARDRDLDESMALLRAALGNGGRAPEDTCTAVLDALLPARPTDDIALLVARTHALADDRIAEWDVATDPVAVAEVRALAVAQLALWGLDDAAFATELILSELVTNAIRYGSAPVQVRLLRDRALICEVSDGSSTSPHLRHAATTDEGGRGLFLVSQLAERWGTRHTAAGKVIWAEQTVPEPAEGPGRPSIEPSARLPRVRRTPDVPLWPTSHP